MILFFAPLSTYSFSEGEYTVLVFENFPISTKSLPLDNIVNQNLTTVQFLFCPQQFFSETAYKVSPCTLKSSKYFLRQLEISSEQPLTTDSFHKKISLFIVMLGMGC